MFKADEHQPVLLLAVSMEVYDVTMIVIRKWTPLIKLKIWMILFAFHLVLIPLEKA